MESRNPKTHFDVTIIGAGIGGLVAGAYLAKAGLKVAIVERMGKVGGYCGSFSKEGFTFDEAVHYINNMGIGGLLRKICEELELTEKIKIVSIDPSDRLIMPDLEITIYHDTHKTVLDLQKRFPREAQAIENFFQLVTRFDFASLYVKYQNSVLQNLLDEFFTDDKLKTALGIFATTLGLPARKLSALAALAYYKGSVLDGGYHPLGGAQTFSDVLSQQFQAFGGQVLLGVSVKQILTKKKCVEGIALDDGTVLQSQVVISNCDATQTFLKLIDANRDLDKDFTTKLLQLRPSTSNFVVYLGIETSLKDIVPSCCNLWYMPHYQVSEETFDITMDQNDMGFVHIGLSSLHDRSLAPKNCESLVLFVGASFRTLEYWNQNKARLTDILIRRAERIIPGLSRFVRVKLPGTPYTLHRYTLNRDGAYRGWDPTPDQTKWGLVPQRTSISGLYLAGHWVTTPVGNGGVSMVAQSGRNVARAVIRAVKLSKT